MSGAEKVAWLKAILVQLVFAMAVITMIAFLGIEDRITEAIRITLITNGAILVGYLLILSWRGAYLSGRKDR